MLEDVDHILECLMAKDSKVLLVGYNVCLMAYSTRTYCAHVTTAAN